jgi:hypothetical protein
VREVKDCCGSNSNGRFGLDDDLKRVLNEAAILHCPFDTAVVQAVQDACRPAWSGTLIDDELITELSDAGGSARPD